MKKESVEFLKELQHELLTQDKLSQADPRFWVIRDYKLLVIPDDYAEDYRIYDVDWNEYTFTEFLNEIKENIDDHNYLIGECDLADEDYWNIKRITEMIEDEEKASNWTIVGVKKEAFNVPDTMFLTNREAQEHLKENSHHYTAEAHTYAMTAWRSPQVERLINILQTADFN